MLKNVVQRFGGSIQKGDGGSLNNGNTGKIMDKSVIALKKRFQHIFQKKGEEGLHLKLIENLPESSQRSLLSQALLRQEELPVLGSYHNEESWFLLTTERILLKCLNDELMTLPFEEIRTADVDFGKMQSLGLTLANFDELRVHNWANKIIILRVEPRGPLVGIWNVLLHIAWRNHKKTEVISEKIQ